MPVSDNWEIAITKFRSLGGVAENICQKVGKNGRGLFPIDSTLESKIFVPKNLLINRDHVCLRQGQVIIKDGLNYPEEVSKFFSFYQENFSWGNGGKESTEAFEKDLQAFPSEIKEFLKISGIIDINKRHVEFSDDFIFKTYLSTRSFGLNGKFVLAPYIELVNYSPKSLNLLRTEEGFKHPGIEISDKEITHHYSYMSSIERWVTSGFSAEEPIVFSLPFKFNIRSSNLILICKGKSLTKDQVEFSRVKNYLIVEGIPIGHNSLKEFPRNYLKYLFGILNIEFDLENKFQEIITYNTKTRIDIIDKISNINSEFVKSLIKTLSIELETLSGSS